LFRCVISRKQFFKCFYKRKSIPIGDTYKRIIWYHSTKKIVRFKILLIIKSAFFQLMFANFLDVFFCNKFLKISFNCAIAGLAKAFIVLWNPSEYWVNLTFIRKVKMNKITRILLRLLRVLPLDTSGMVLPITRVSDFDKT
jgi:hypothetical protein